MLCLEVLAIREIISPWKANKKLRMNFQKSLYSLTDTIEMYRDSQLIAISPKMEKALQAS